MRNDPKYYLSNLVRDLERKKAIAAEAQRRIDAALQRAKDMASVVPIVHIKHLSGCPARTPGWYCDCGRARK